MGNIIGRFLLPHPPTAIPVLDKNAETKLRNTVQSLKEAAKEIAALQPDTVILITPHGPRFQGHYYLPSQKRVSGDFSAFGDKKHILGFDNDVELGKKLENAGAGKNVSVGFIDDKTMKRNNIPYDLDYGVTVPLYYLTKEYTSFRLLPVSLGDGGPKDHYRLGILLRDVIRDSFEGNAVVIASGDMAHGTGETAAAFDKTVKQLLLKEASEELLSLDPAVKADCEECGLDVCRVLLGTLDGFAYLTNLLSYEAPFGTGYLAARFDRGKPKESAYIRYLAEEEEILKKRREAESPAVKLARTAMEAWLYDRRVVTLPADAHPELKQPGKGVFVTLTKDGHFRGGCESIFSTLPTVGEEIIENSITALKDPCFDPLLPEDLKELAITVNVVETAEEITDGTLPDPAHYGLAVERKGRLGAVLPGTKGIKTPEEQLRAAKEKAGIHPWHRVRKIRFITVTYR